MSTMKPFDRYTVEIHGGVDGRVGMLLCYQGSLFAGRIDFLPDGVASMQDYLWHPGPIGEHIVLAMPMSRFEAVMSTVRSEKPLALYIDVNIGTGAFTPGHGHLRTSEREPVGEETTPC